VEYLKNKASVNVKKKELENSQRWEIFICKEYKKIPFGDEENNVYAQEIHK